MSTVLLLMQKQDLNTDHCPSFPLMFLIRKKKILLFLKEHKHGHDDSLCFMAYIKKAKQKSVNQPKPLQKSTDKTNPQKTHKKTQHKQTLKTRAKTKQTIPPCKTADTQE